MSPRSAWQQEFDVEVNSQVCTDNSCENVSFSKTIISLCLEVLRSGNIGSSSKSVTDFWERAKSWPCCSAGQGFPFWWNATFVTMERIKKKLCMGVAAKAKNISHGQSIYMDIWPSDICRSLSNCESPSNVFPHRFPQNIREIRVCFCVHDYLVLYILVCCFHFSWLMLIWRKILCVTSGICAVAWEKPAHGEMLTLHLQLHLKI